MFGKCGVGAHHTEDKTLSIRTIRSRAVVAQFPAAIPAGQGRPGSSVFPRIQDPGSLTPVRNEMRYIQVISTLVVALSMALTLGAQRRQDYPVRPPADAAAVERGKALYGVNCQFCHGADTRGGDGGPSLLRSSIVFDDDHRGLMGS